MTDPRRTSHEPRATSHEQLFALLRRFRRRLVFVAFVRTLPLAAVTGSVAALAIARGGHFPATAVATALLIGLFIASVATASIAWRRTGRLRQTAATLDRRFGLANSVATALQFAGHEDEVSQLILADAQRMLRRHEPNELPFEAPTHLAWLLIVVAAAGVLFVWTGISSNVTGDVAASQGVLGGVATASPSIEKRKSTTPNVVAADAIEGAPRSHPTDSNGQSVASASRQEADTAHRTGGDAKPSDANQLADAGRSSPRTLADAARDSAGTRGANAGVQAERGESTSAGDASGNPAGARGARGGTRALAELRTETGGTGGVRGAPAQEGPASDAEHRAGSPAAASTSIATWDKAESALEREQLPVALRSYVHDYLIAIKPGSQP